MRQPPRPTMSAKTAEEVADVMFALSSPNRVRILGLLRERHYTVGELMDALDMEQSAVSHQLRLLRHLGLVTGTRQGKNTVYALYDNHVAALLDEAVYHSEHLRLGLRDQVGQASIDTIA